MEITPHVHSLPAPAPIFMGLYAPNVYLVAGGEGLLVDSGYADEAALKARLEQLRGFHPLKLKAIVITHPHPDHLGGAEGIKEATGALLFAHSTFSSPEVDRPLKDGDILQLEDIALEVIHTPGHHPAHICLYLREEKVLFSGDNVLGVGTTVVRPGQGDMALYIASLQKLLRYDIQLICPGHGPVVRQAQRKVQELIHHRLEREEQVIVCLKRGKGTVAEMVAEIYPELDPRLHEEALAQVQAHLEKLIKEERVSVAGKRYQLKG